MSPKECPHCGARVPGEQAASGGECPECGGDLPEETPPTGHSGPQHAGGGEDRAGEPTEILSPGDVVQGFRVEEKIGSGGMAEVYRATQLSLERPVALKVLHSRLTGKERFVELFEGETATLATLNHPNIVGIIDRGRVDDTYFFAMEYVSGTTLKRVVNSRHIGIEFFLRIFQQCARALHYVHQQGIIHRDIKLGNILLDEHKNVKIADFGLAQLLAGGREEEGRRAFGTPGYIAPELKEDPGRTDPACDIFSLGAVMYRVLTGRLPRELPPPPIRRFREGISESLEDLILRCLREDPEERIGDAAELLEGLDTCRRELTLIRKECPACREENPLDEMVCLGCGADLSEMTLHCPECGREGTCAEEECPDCGTDLSAAREEIADRLGALFERARGLAELARQGEAIGELRKVLEVAGELFGWARQRARHLIDRYQGERNARFVDQVKKGKELTQRADPEAAVRVWEEIPDDVAEAFEVPQLIQTARYRMQLARRAVRQADELVGQGRYEEAGEILEKAGRNWADCPGLGDAQYRLQVRSEKSGELDERLAGAKRMLEEGRFEEAAEEAAALADRAPEEERVQRLRQEIRRVHQDPEVRAVLRAAREAESAGEPQRAAGLWKKAAGAFSADDPHRQRLLRRAKRTAEVAISSEAGDGRGQSEATARVPLGNRPGLKIGAAVVLLLAVLAVAVWWGSGIVEIWRGPRRTAGEPRRTEHRPEPKPETPEVPAVAPEQTEEPAEVPESPGKPRFFQESFDDASAENWSFLRGRWRVMPIGRRVLRAMTEDGRAVAEHRYFEETNCTTSAWVRVDAIERPGCSVSIAVRRTGDSEVRLTVHRREEGWAAQVTAVNGEEVQKKTDVRGLPGTSGDGFEATLRLDARGDTVTGQVGDTLVGRLRGLSGEFARSGAFALRADLCRTSWDEISLSAPRRGVAQHHRPEAAGGDETGEEARPAETEEPKIPLITAVEPASDTSALSLEEWSVRLQQSFAQNAAGWEAGQGEWKRNRGGFGPAGGEGGSAFCRLGRFADVDLTATVRAGGAPEANSDAAAGLVARYDDGKNHVFFGIVGTGQGQWTVQMATVQGGKKRVRSVAGGPYRWPRSRRVKLRLVIRGDKACGYVNGTAVAGVSGLGKLAPSGGRMGLVLRNMGGAFRSTDLRAVEPPAAAESWEGGTDWTVPDEVVFERAKAPALARVGECGGRYVVFEGLTAGSGTMTVTASFEGLEGYPQFSLCAAARGQRGPMLAQMVDFQRGGSAAVVRMLGILPYRGELKSATYGGRRFEGLATSKPMELTVALQPKEARTSLGGENVATYKPGKVPLPQKAGRWGFRCTDLTATIHRIELEF